MFGSLSLLASIKQSIYSSCRPLSPDRCPMADGLYLLSVFHLYRLNPSQDYQWDNYYIYSWSFLWYCAGHKVIFFKDVFYNDRQCCFMCGLIMRLKIKINIDDFVIRGRSSIGQQLGQCINVRFLKAVDCMRSAPGQEALRPNSECIPLWKVDPIFSIYICSKTLKTEDVWGVIGLYNSLYDWFFYNILNTCLQRVKYFRCFR